MNPMRVGGSGDPRAEPRDPIQILPEEMWLEILEYLKQDPRDVLNLAGTCAQFGDMVGREVDLASCQLEEVIPLVLQELPQPDVLNCRGVCKRVRKSVDEVLDNLQLIRPHNAPLFPRLVPPNKNPREYEKRHFAINGFRDDLRVIDSVEKIEELRRMIEGKEVSTVVTKKLSFQFTWDEDDPPSSLTPPDFLDKMLALLNTDLLRGQLLHLCLFGDEEVFRAAEDPNWTYDIIRRCVATLPNLRRFYCMDLPDVDEGDGASSLGRYIANGHPLPVAPLKIFSIDRAVIDPCPVSLFQEVTRRYCGTLTELSFYLDDGEIGNFDWEEVYHFPALVKLELGCVSWHFQPVLARMHAPQLEQLSCKVYEPVDPFLAALLFRTLLLLQKFPLLSEFTLKVSSGVVGDRFEALEEFRDQRHGNVKHLELKGHWYNIPLGFFAGCFPNLESISVDCEYICEQRRDNADPDLVLCRRIQMERSGLWNRLPKLCSFWCGDHLRTRADVDAFQNRRA